MTAPTLPSSRFGTTNAFSAALADVAALAAAGPGLGAVLNTSAETRLAGQAAEGL